MAKKQENSNSVEVKSSLFKVFKIFHDDLPDLSDFQELEETKKTPKSTKTRTEFEYYSLIFKRHVGEAGVAVSDVESHSDFAIGDEVMGANNDTGNKNSCIVSLADVFWEEINQNSSSEKQGQSTNYDFPQSESKSSKRPGFIVLAHPNNNKALSSINFKYKDRLVRIQNLDISGLTTNHVTSLLRIMAQRSCFSLTLKSAQSAASSSNTGGLWDRMKAFMNLPEKDKSFLCLNRAKAHGVLILKCLQYLEMYALRYNDIFLTSLSRGSKQDKHEFAFLREALAAVCSTERYCESAIWYNLSEVFVPKKREHVELVCFLLCESLNVALPSRLISINEHDLYTGQVCQFEKREDNLRACFKAVFENCEKGGQLTFLLQFLGFIKRLEIIEHLGDTEAGNSKRNQAIELPLHFCCMAAPYLMEIPDPNMLLSLSRGGLRYHFELGIELVQQNAVIEEDDQRDVFNKNSNDQEYITGLNLVKVGPKEGIWNIIPVLTSIMHEYIDILIETDFFSHNSPVELFQSTSVWRTGDNTINIRANEVNRLCVNIINGCIGSGSISEFTEYAKELFKEADESVAKQCLLGASAIPHILFNVFEESLIPSFLYDEFVTAGACICDQVQLNTLLSRLVSTMPSDRRYALERLCSFLSLILHLENSHRSRRDEVFWEPLKPTPHSSWISKRFGPCILRPLLRGQEDAARHEVEIISVTQKAIGRILIPLIFYKDSIFVADENELTIKRGRASTDSNFAGFHSRFAPP